MQHTIIPTTTLGNRLPNRLTARIMQFVARFALKPYISRTPKQAVSSGHIHDDFLVLLDGGRERECVAPYRIP